MCTHPRQPASIYRIDILMCDVSQLTSWSTYSKVWQGKQHSGYRQIPKSLSKQKRLIFCVHLQYKNSLDLWPAEVLWGGEASIQPPFSTLGSLDVSWRADPNLFTVGVPHIPVWWTQVPLHQRRQYQNQMCAFDFNSGCYLSMMHVIVTVSLFSYNRPVNI